MTYKEYLEKIELINSWDKAYYESNDPLATDQEYDRLLQEILFYENQSKLVNNDSPTQRVGYKVENTTTHLSKMLSLSNVFNSNELDTWIEQVGSNNEFICEPKYDGLSLNLIYKNGILINAITRGDGIKGQDVMNNIPAIKSIPQNISIKEHIEIRGEVVMSKQTFIELNKERAINGEKLFANPRNATSGSLKLQNLEETKERGLIFKVWSLGNNTLNLKTHYEIMEKLYNEGFTKHPFSIKCKSFSEINEAYEEFIDIRDSLDIALDGMVIKINNIQKQITLGNSNRYPKWACAYKFPPVEKSTKLLSVNFQIARSGNLTPVANFEPINIDGTIVKRATLHNINFIQSIDLKIGDQILVIKSGDIIPKITKVLTNRRTGQEKEIDIPSFCPNCNAPLKMSNTLIKCTNDNCGSIKTKSLLHFASKNAMNIKGLGSKTIEKLSNSGLIKTPLDLYKLKEKDFRQLNIGYGERKNLLLEIENSRKQDLSKLILGLNIPGCGQRLSEILANTIGKKLPFIREHEILSLEQTSFPVSKKIYKFIQENRFYIYQLINIINPSKTSQLANVNNLSTSIEKTGKLQGTKISITGTFSKSRDYIKSILHSEGANVSTTLSKNTNYLLLGKKPGSKLNTAIDLGIEIINETDLFKKLNLGEA